MDAEELRNLVNRGLSVREIADEVGKSFTSIRYWLRTHDLKTSKRVEFKCPCGEQDPSKFYGHKRHICGKCQNAYVLKKGRENRHRIIAHLGGECAGCGYKQCTAAFDVHHLDPTKKDRDFGSSRGWAWARIEEELRDCVLLCKNCHAEVHAGQRVIRDVAQSGSAPVLGTGGYEFESRHPD